jgi:hypothetical protein
MNESMGNMRDKWIRIKEDKEDKRGRFSFSSLPRIKGDVSNSHPYRGIMITP